MKKIKISLIAVIAIVMGIAGSAFTSTTHNVDEEWFIIEDAQHPELATSYSYFGSSAPCAGQAELCAIKGTRDTFPNNDLPTQESVDHAAAESNNFTMSKEGLVEFRAN